MNKDKIIKDLKERNEKLSNQYRLRDIRCVHLERENKRLKEEYMFLQNASDEYEEKLLNREAELLDRIYKAQIFIQQNIRDIDYDTEEYDYLMKILGGDVDDE